MVTLFHKLTPFITNKNVRSQAVRYNRVWLYINDYRFTVTSSWDLYNFRFDNCYKLKANVYWFKWFIGTFFIQEFYNILSSNLCWKHPPIVLQYLCLFDSWIANYPFGKESRLSSHRSFWRNNQVTSLKFLEWEITFCIQIMCDTLYPPSDTECHPDFILFVTLLLEVDVFCMITRRGFKRHFLTISFNSSKQIRLDISSQIIWMAPDNFPFARINEESSNESKIFYFKISC